MEVVPHGRRIHWLSGERLAHELGERAADPGDTSDLSALAGQTLDEL